MVGPMAQRIAARLFRWLRLALVAYLICLLVLMIFEEKLIFFPAPYPKGDWQPAGSAFEDAWAETADGVAIHGWFLEHPQPKAVILFAHGNAGNITSRDEVVRLLHALGASVLVFDYRGYGRSAGSPNEAGILADARAARGWLAQRTGVAENQVVLAGESLGGGVQVDLAAADGARGLILLNTFDSLPDVAATIYPWWIPVRKLMRTRLDSAAKIGRYQGPLLQVHGDRDRIVPLACARRLFDAANQPKELILVAGGDHNDPVSPTTLKSIGRFLDELPVADVQGNGS
jgi:hypothetical protein